MKSGKRNYDILKRIVKYCDQIAGAKERFGNSIEALKSDDDYMNATAMCILQIGELSGHLSTEFREAHKEIPWRAMKNMRNIAAHQYEDFSAQYLWDTISEDIPALRGYCATVVKQFEILEQDCKEEIDYIPDEDMDVGQGQSMKMG